MKASDLDGFTGDFHQTFKEKNTISQQSLSENRSRSNNSYSFYEASITLTPNWTNTL